MTKYSILFPYLNRYNQLVKTLESFQTLYHGRNDFEVLVVLDNKCSIKEEDEINALSYYMGDFFPMLVTVNHTSVYDSSTAYNLGSSCAIGEFLVITNPECYHETNILKGLDEEFDKNKDVYVLCACKSLKQDDSFEMWYHHSTHNPRMLHFCTAIKAENYEKIGGFNEEYDKGIGYNDDDFRERVKNEGIPFILRDDLIVDHLHHNRDHQSHPELIERNRLLFNQIWNQQR
jgi:hypothetical protein